ncbi:transposase [Chryseobacterium indologenes]|uniref:transposase n=1 Tax=Chryseobacterium TaxID=59732 RepID=UPI00162972C3|nr:MULTISPECIES: transposase [Chryseobacterium]MDM1553613.1 transposase [Chryseobacterium indologenes]WET48416.1 transposase [Chryseobacterium indologenes]
MKLDFKNIHIGSYIKCRVDEQGIDIVRICNFLKVTEPEINEMYLQKSLDTEILLRWSKLLEYDFFRVYTQHLIIFAPQDKIQYNAKPKKQNSSLPAFRKNIYTKEVIDFILELLNTGKKTKLQIIEEYGIPKTTLYKWIVKYNEA